jgi:hypothetical protein
MPPDEPVHLTVLYERHMPRQRDDEALEAILAMTAAASSPDAVAERQLLIGIWQLLLDIRDRLPPPSE